MTDNDMLQTGLNYELLVEDALRSVVRSSLSIVENVGLPGETHFYIGFSTIHKGVEIDDHLRAKHPENMTIVLNFYSQSFVEFSWRSCQIVVNLRLCLNMFKKGG